MSEQSGSPGVESWQVSSFEKFTEKTRKALGLAVEEANAKGHPFVGTEHQLLGLIQVEDGVAARALVALGVDLGRLRSAVEGMLAEIDASAIRERGLTPRARKVIDLAVQEAKRLKHHYIGTEHLLLGLIREHDGPAAKALASHGVTLEVAWRQVIQMLNNVTRDTPPAGPKSNVIACRVEDRDLDAIDALIEAGISSTRSEAASLLISLGIQANKELFESINTTVAEIRRLRGEAQGIARQAILRADMKLAREGE